MSALRLGFYNVIVNSGPDALEGWTSVRLIGEYIEIMP